MDVAGGPAQTPGSSAPQEVAEPSTAPAASAATSGGVLFAQPHPYSSAPSTSSGHYGGGGGGGMAGPKGLKWKWMMDFNKEKEEREQRERHQLQASEQNAAASSAAVDITAARGTSAISGVKHDDAKRKAGEGTEDAASAGTFQHDQIKDEDAAVEHHKGGQDVKVKAEAADLGPASSSRGAKAGTTKPDPGEDSGAPCGSDSYRDTTDAKDRKHDVPPAAAAAAAAPPRPAAAASAAVPTARKPGRLNKHPHAPPGGTAAPSHLSSVRSKQQLMDELEDSMFTLLPKALAVPRPDQHERSAQAKKAATPRAHSAVVPAAPAAAPAPPPVPPAALPPAATSEAAELSQPLAGAEAAAATAPAAAATAGGTGRSKEPQAPAAPIARNSSAPTPLQINIAAPPATERKHDGGTSSRGGKLSSLGVTAGRDTPMATPGSTRGPGDTTPAAMAAGGEGGKPDTLSVVASECLAERVKRKHTTETAPSAMSPTGGTGRSAQAGPGDATAPLAPAAKYRRLTGGPAAADRQQQKAGQEQQKAGQEPAGQEAAGPLPAPPAGGSSRPGRLSAVAVPSASGVVQGATAAVAPEAAAPAALADAVGGEAVGRSNSRDEDQTARTAVPVGQAPADVAEGRSRAKGDAAGRPSSKEAAGRSSVKESVGRPALKEEQRTAKEEPPRGVKEEQQAVRDERKAAKEEQRSSKEEQPAASKAPAASATSSRPAGKGAGTAGGGGGGRDDAPTHTKFPGGAERRAGGTTGAAGGTGGDSATPRQGGGGGDKVPAGNGDRKSAAAAAAAAAAPSGGDGGTGSGKGGGGGGEAKRHTPEPSATAAEGSKAPMKRAKQSDAGHHVSPPAATSSQGPQPEHIVECFFEGTVGDGLGDGRAPQPLPGGGTDITTNPGYSQATVDLSQLRSFKDLWSQLAIIFPSAIPDRMSAKLVYLDGDGEWMKVSGDERWSTFVGAATKILVSAKC